MKMAESKGGALGPAPHVALAQAVVGAPAKSQHQACRAPTQSQGQAASLTIDVLPQRTA